MAVSFERSSRLRFGRQAVFDWHARPGALARLLPPWERTELVSRTGGLEPGAEVVLRMRKGGLPLRWVAKHVACEPGRSFCDVQARGPFARWVHEHRFEDDGQGSRLVDRVDYAPPLEPLTGWAARPFLDAELERMFSFRHARTRADMSRHDRFSDLGTKRIVLSGASGLVGRALAAFLSTGGHDVVRLVRGEPKGPDEVRWDPARGELDPRALGEVDALVHLSGENVGEGRWTASKKRAILESRTSSTSLLARTIAAMDRKPGVVVSASAVGIYGDRGDELLDESSSRGSGFLADVCAAWEDALEPARRAGVRTVVARLGVVLSASGGALAKLLPVFRLGGGGPVGSGRQVMSWVTLDDVVYALHHALGTASLEGPVNVVAPNPVTNAELATTLGRVLHRPAILPVPALAIRALFGQMGEETILASQRVAPKRLLESGYEFELPRLEEALRHELGKRAD